MIERATVQATESGMATVVMDGSELCGTCCARAACTMGSDGTRVIEVQNPIGARAGDTVRIRIGSGVVLFAGFVVFIVPIFGILLGYAIIIALTGNQHAAVAGGLAGLAVAFLLARWWDRRMLRGRRHMPTIVEILARKESAGGSDRG
jgi:sigma-E factor negative regulatory protein RseC